MHNNGPSQLNRNLHYGTVALGHLVIRPNAAAHASRFFIRMGIRDPREAMRRANALGMACYLHFALMFFTAPVAIAAAFAGSTGWHGVLRGDPGSSDDSVALFMALVVFGVGWLWFLKVINGWILRCFTKDLYSPPWNHFWWWPVTVRSSLRLTRIPSVISDQRLSAAGRSIDVFNILTWALFIKLPLYAAMTAVAYSLANVVWLSL